MQNFFWFLRLLLITIWLCLSACHFFCLNLVRFRRVSNRSVTPSLNPPKPWPHRSNCRVSWPLTSVRSFKNLTITKVIVSVMGFLYFIYIVFQMLLVVKYRQPWQWRVRIKWPLKVMMMSGGYLVQVTIIYYLNNHFGSHICYQSQLAA